VEKVYVDLNDHDIPVPLLARSEEGLCWSCTSNTLGKQHVAVVKLQHTNLMKRLLQLQATQLPQNKAHLAVTIPAGPLVTGPAAAHPFGSEEGSKAHGASVIAVHGGQQLGQPEGGDDSERTPLTQGHSASS
jgi:hypothetical protein